MGKFSNIIYPDSKIMEIALLIRDTKLSFKAIAEQTGVTQDMVSKVYSKEYRSNVTKDIDFSKAYVRKRHATSKVVTDEMISTIYNMLMDGEPLVEIQLALDISYPTLRKIIDYKFEGVKFPDKRTHRSRMSALTTEHAREIYKLFNIGVSAQQLALTYGVSNSQIVGIGHGITYKFATYDLRQSDQEKNV